MRSNIRLVAVLLVVSVLFLVGAVPKEIAQTDSTAPWFIAASFATWVVFLGYVFFVSRKQNDLQKQIDELRGTGPKHRA